MRRLFTIILLLAAFLGGYHLGRKPDSPDVIGWVGEACSEVDRVTLKIVDKADAEDTSTPEAAIAYMRESSGQ